MFKNFGYSPLEGADLEGANLKRANLWGASLEGTHQEGANLKRTYLDRDNLCRVKETLMDNGPVITIEDTDHSHNRALYLKHSHDGHDLQLEHTERSMAYLNKLWGHDVHLEIVINSKKALLSWKADIGFSTKPVK